MVLLGPNVWSRFPVLDVWVELDELKEIAAGRLAELEERLAAWLASPHGGVRGVGRLTSQGGPMPPQEQLVYLLMRTALRLQVLVDQAVSFGRTRATSEPAVYRVAVQYEDEIVGRACMDAALTFCLAAAAGRPLDAAAEIARLRAVADANRYGPSTQAMLRAAEARGLPVYPINEEDGRLLQLGQGARARRILAAETEGTGSIARMISQDKELTKRLLRSAGVPVPEGRAVKDLEDGWSVVCAFGFPVVVKPRDRDIGKGVHLDVRTRERFEAAYAAAYAAALDKTDSVVVERFVPGVEHRLLVVNQRMVAAARVEPAQVKGDGHSTIVALIEAVNRDPLRHDRRRCPMRPMFLDTHALTVLADQGYEPESVPPAGARVLVRRNPPYIKNGGILTDETDLVHPEVAARVVEATRLIGLDVAGIDVVALDISRPLEEQGGVIVEVNAGPGIEMNLSPWPDGPHPVGQAIVASLFREGETGRIPVVAVTGTNGKTTTSRLIAHIIQAAGSTVGMTCTDGIYLGGRRIEKGDCSGPLSARAVLTNRLVDMAVLETARGAIVKRGVGFDRCDVAVVTNIGTGDHLGGRGTETLDNLVEVKGLVVRLLHPGGAAVLNAADPLVAPMASSSPAPVTFFAIDGNHPRIVAHRNGGGQALFVRDGVVFTALGEREEALVSVSHVPITCGGRAEFQLENVLAAAGAAWALDVPHAAIRAGLKSFSGDVETAPGRFNLFDYRRATVVVDYAHNASALEALTRALDQFPGRRRVVVYSCGGSRRDSDMVSQGEILGARFDRVILYEDQCTYDRPDGEIIGLLRQGIGRGRRASEVVETRGEFAAIDLALEDVKPGDLVILCPESIDEALAHVRSRLESSEPAS
jgi:cyanophycin synthetase